MYLSAGMFTFRLNVSIYSPFLQLCDIVLLWLITASDHCRDVGHCCTVFVEPDTFLSPSLPLTVLSLREHISHALPNISIYQKMPYLVLVMFKKWSELVPKSIHLFRVIFFKCVSNFLRHHMHCWSRIPPQLRWAQCGSCGFLLE